MTQKLATLKAGARPLTFGLSIRFHPVNGMRAEGRADTPAGAPAYVGPWFNGVTDSQVDITDVADNYVLPLPLPDTPTAGRDITRNEFLDIGMAVDAVVMNAVLKDMPVVAAYLDDYKTAAGIRFQDASPPVGDEPSPRLHMLLAAAIQAGIITEDTVTAFLAKWVELYPAS